MKLKWIVVMLVCVGALAKRGLMAQALFEDGFENIAVGDYPDENG